MLADEERKVFRETQFEVGREQFGQHVYGRGDSPAPDPMFPRRVILEPSEWRGEEKLTARANELRQAREKLPRFGQAAEKVRSKNDVERSEILAQGHGVADLEGDARGIDVARPARGGAGCAVALDDELVIGRTSFVQSLCRFNKGTRVIDSDDLPAMTGKFEGRASDGTTNVQRACVGAQRTDIEQFGHAALGETQSTARPVGPRKNFFRRSVVEEEVFPDQPVGLVDVRGHAAPAI